MKRRNFLRLCAAAVTAPTALLKGKPKTLWVEGKGDSRIEGVTIKARQQGMSGVTHDQLCELIQTTLKDLPPMMFETAWNGQTYELCHNEKREYYPGGWC